MGRYAQNATRKPVFFASPTRQDNKKQHQCLLQSKEAPIRVQEGDGTGQDEYGQADTEGESKTGFFDQHSPDTHRYPITVEKKFKQIQGRLNHPAFRESQNPLSHSVHGLPVLRCCVLLCL